MDKNLKACQRPGCQNSFKPFRTTDKYCSSECAYQEKKRLKKPVSPKNIKPINRRSKKLSTLERKYSELRAEFLLRPENRFCPVTCGKTTEVHHKMGRVGYADEWARQMGIPLLIDVRFFLAVSHKGHQEIENKPEWAYKMGYSIRRTVTHYGKIT